MLDRKSNQSTFTAQAFGVILPVTVKVWLRPFSLTPRDAQNDIAVCLAWPAQRFELVHHQGLQPYVRVAILGALALYADLPGGVARTALAACVMAMRLTALLPERARKFLRLQIGDQRFVGAEADASWARRSGTGI
jgi:hypothetical protein